MKILAIETSCDETAVAVLECSGGIEAPEFKVLGNALYSQAATHAAYGGVFPNLAKREHARNLTPLLEEALRQANMLKNENTPIDRDALSPLLEREPGLTDALIPVLETLSPPDIDCISVTEGPGLEPALWVGINFAQALGKAWNKPVIGINHMEGHVVSVLYGTSKSLEYPALALLVSGGHTELVLSDKPLSYELLGQTQDDAIGEAFDKVARLLGLPYPGGPRISALAEEARDQNLSTDFRFPRPMHATHNFNFSYSGLKTAGRYKIQELGTLTPELTKAIAREFEDAALDVLISKTRKALLEYAPKTLIIAGGVSANKELRKRSHMLAEEFGIPLRLPAPELSTDNAIMIGMAGYMRFLAHTPSHTLKASGTMRIENSL